MLVPEQERQSCVRSQVLAAAARGFLQPPAVLFNNKRPHLSPGGGVLHADNLPADEQDQIIAGAGSLMPGGIGVLPGMSGLLGGSLIGVGTS